MKSIATCMVALLVIALGACTTATGEEITLQPEQPDRDAVVKVAPDRFEETIEPGVPYSGVIDVFNIGSRPVRLQAGAEDIRAAEQGAGDIEFLGQAPDGVFARFLEIDTEPFTLEPGEAQRLPFRIDVPKSARFAGSFGAVLFRIIPRDGGDATVRQSGRVGTLFVLGGAKAAPASVAIEALRVAGGWAETNHTVTVGVANTGTAAGPRTGAAARPTGKVTIRNALGRVVASGSLRGSVLLPGGRASFEERFHRRFWLGRYTVTATVAATRDGDARVTRSTTFWAISPLGMLAVLLTLLIAGVGVRSLIWRRRSYWMRWADEADEDGTSDSD